MVLCDGDVTGQVPANVNDTGSVTSADDVISGSGSFGMQRGDELRQTDGEGSFVVHVRISGQRSTV